MNALLKISLRYGALAGVVGAGLLLGLYFMGRHPLLIPVYLDFRIFLFAIFIFFALRELRDYYYDGVLYFSQGILASFIFTTCYALTASLILVVFIYFAPAFLSEYITLQIQQLKSLPSEAVEAIGKDIYDTNLALLPATRGFDLGLIYFVQSFGIGFFISIILSVTLRRQPKT